MILLILKQHKKFGKIPFKTYPRFSFIKQRIVNRRIELKPLLYYVKFDKEEAKNIMQKEIGWKEYGQKHYENIFTRFYQGYILPEKFNVNKRQFHLSVLVQSGQISRDTALSEDKLPLYDNDQLEKDKVYVIKKLGFTEIGFEAYMKAPIKKHSDYATVQKYWNAYFKATKILKPLKKIIVSKSK